MAIFTRRRCQFTVLGEDEVQALVTADVEGRVTNARMQEISTRHPADITRMLQNLARQGCLIPEGMKRGKWYALPPLPSGDSIHLTGDSIHSGTDSLHLTGDSPQLGGSSPQLGGSSLQLTRSSPQLIESSLQLTRSSPQLTRSSIHLKGNSIHLSKSSFHLNETTEPLPDDVLLKLQELASEARNNKKLGQARLRQLLLSLCEARFLTAEQLGKFTDRKFRDLQYRYLRPMVSEGLLELRFPDKPNHSNQAYRTRKKPA